jgi:hypothetical protein
MTSETAASMQSRAVALSPSLRWMRIASALLVLICAVVLIWSLSVRNMEQGDSIPVRALTFYGLTAGAYILLPFVRRGDIAVVAMWVVLGVGIAPCFAGRELSAPQMFADMAGVLMSAGPVYIARFRQIAQGDIRPYRRRDIETGF